MNYLHFDNGLEEEALLDALNRELHQACNAVENIGPACLDDDDIIAACRRVVALAKLRDAATPEATPA